MAKSVTGKLVSKVGAAGGGKAYKKSRPLNYYGALVVIAVLGLASVVLSRYDYQHPSTSQASGTPPTIGTTWFAGLSMDICGVNQALLPADPTYKGGFQLDKNDVIRIAPVSAADSGNHATVGQFANEYPGLIASSTELALPLKNGMPTAATTYRNGLLCPAGSPFAKKAGTIEYAYWTSFGQSAPTITTNPSSIKFTNQMEITLAFLPKGAVPARPGAATVTDMVQANAAAATATTTTLGTTTTVVNATTKATTTTTAKG